jgi:hypothetical protein
MFAAGQVPLYPPLARVANVEGVVHLKVTTDGHRVVDAHVEDGEACWLLPPRKMSELGSLRFTNRPHLR